MEELQKLKRKELIRIAKIYGIKNRNKMKKNELIRAIKKARKPIEELRKTEEKLKRELSKKTEETHLIVLPKEPGYVYVNWEVKGKEEKVGTLIVFEDDKEKFSIPVNLDYGRSYIHIEEDKKVKVELGVEKNGKFETLLESNEVIVPTTKKTEGRKEFRDIKTFKMRKEGIISEEEIKKVVEGEEKTAKEIKYSRE
jgi:hypothetical protein